MKFPILSFTLLFFTLLMTQAEDATVRMTSSLQFNPETVIVNVGDNVTWVNDDFEPHTATSNTGLWNTLDVNEGEAVFITFNAAGSYPYRCIYHSNPAGTSGMIGTVIVVAPTELRLTFLSKSDSNFSVSLNTSTGSIYVLQKSTNLLSGWTSIRTNTASGNSMIFSDGSATNGQSFYRAFLQP